MFEAAKKAETRSIVIGFKVTPSERRWLADMAQRNDMSMSDVTRMGLALLMTNLPEGATEATEGRPQMRRTEGNVDYQRR